MDSGLPEVGLVVESQRSMTGTETAGLYNFVKIKAFKGMRNCKMAASDSLLPLNLSQPQLCIGNIMPPTSTPITMLLFDP